MLSSGQSSSKYLKTEIPQMLAIIHLQDLRYWFPFSINIQAETKHYTHVVGLKLQRRHDSSGKHSHSTLTPAHQTHTDGDECSADSFCFVCACVFRAYTWAWAFFRAESSDLSHMGVISVWALLRANTVVFSFLSPTAKMFQNYRHKCWPKTSRQELLGVLFDLQIFSSGCRCSLSCS